MKLFNKLIKSVTDLFKEKREKFVNRGQQDLYMERRNRALDILLDPKSRLTGPQRRGYMASLGRPLDPSEMSLRRPKEPALRWFNRVSQLNIRQLGRWATRAKHRVSRLEREHAEAKTQRQRRLIEPKLDLARAIQQAVKEVATLRSMPRSLVNS